MDWKTLYQPGEPVSFATQFPLKTIRIDNKNMTPIFGLRKYWGTASFRKKNKFTVYGEYLDRKQNFLMSFLYNDIEYFFTLEGKIDLPDVKSGNKLQLSRETWKKVSNKKDDDVKRIQRRKIRRVTKESKGLFTNYCWMRPLNSVVVSPFASPRTLPNGRSYFHSGMDLRARSPKPLPAPARGQIVLGEHMIVPGNVIVIDHGGGITTRYMHLSRITKNVGDFVEKGEIVGYTGGTGRVEAPHLHWEVLWNGRQVNPLVFLEFAKPMCGENK